MIKEDQTSEEPSIKETCGEITGETEETIKKTCKEVNEACGAVKESASAVKDSATSVSPNFSSFFLMIIYIQIKLILAIYNIIICKFLYKGPSSCRSIIIIF